VPSIPRRGVRPFDLADECESYLAANGSRFCMMLLHLRVGLHETWAIRKSGYLACVLELPPVSRCHESSFRNCRSSSNRLNRRHGVAREGNLFTAKRAFGKTQFMRDDPTQFGFSGHVLAAGRLKTRNTSVRSESRESCASAILMWRRLSRYRFRPAYQADRHRRTNCRLRRPPGRSGPRA
jgi:hypothetical protein